MPNLRRRMCRRFVGATIPSTAGQALSQRAQTELELSALESSYSGWIGGTGFGRYRSGTPGFDRLTDLEVPFEASGVLGQDTARDHRTASLSS